MVEMGITVEKAEVALSETGNVGIEVGLWPRPGSPIGLSPSGSREDQEERSQG